MINSQGTRLASVCIVLKAEDALYIVYGGELGLWFDDSPIVPSVTQNTYRSTTGNNDAVYGEELREMIQYALSDRNFLEIGTFITWYAVGPHLPEINGTDIKDIDRDGYNEADKRKKLMDLWESRNGMNATYDALMKAMLMAKKRHEATMVMDLLLYGSGPYLTLYDKLSNMRLVPTHSQARDTLLKWLKSSCSEEHLLQITNFISWNIVGPYLPEITRQDIRDIDKDGFDQPRKRERLMEMLISRNGENATYDAIITAMLDAGERGEAERVIALISPPEVARPLDWLVEVTLSIDTPPVAEFPETRPVAEFPEILQVAESAAPNLNRPPRDPRDDEHPVNDTNNWLLNFVHLRLLLFILFILGVCVLNCRG